jgi:hypothetical protein
MIVRVSKQQAEAEVRMNRSWAWVVVLLLLVALGFGMWMTMHRHRGGEWRNRDDREQRRSGLENGRGRQNETDAPYDNGQQSESPNSFRQWLRSLSGQNSNRGNSSPSNYPSGRPNAPAGSSASIGTAWMTADGTIEMDLRAEGPGRVIGDAHFVYAPTDKQYTAILSHLGGLRPGEHKSVPPWPDQQN